MKFLNNYILYIGVIFLFLSSCNYNGVNYKYSSDDVLIEMNMADSTSIFDLHIAYRLSNQYDQDSISLLLEAISPSNVKYSENVALPSSLAEIERYLIFFPEREEQVKIEKGNTHYDIEWKYRKDIIALEPGIWKISLKNINDNKSLIGLGLHYNERKR